MTTLTYLDQTLESPARTISQIIEVIETDKGTALVLDRTPFYPEGGGQPADHGTIDTVNVLDVQLVGEKIFHYVDQMPSKRDDLLCIVDWNRRTDLTQQHNGQHIISAVLFRDFDAKTIGFHLSEAYTSIDIDVKLTSEDLENVEKTCIELISAGLKISYVYPTDEELETLPLRKQPKVEDNIRIVVIEGLDHSPCGGTHPSLTSEVMGLKITKSENYKGGMRIEFVCGYRFIHYIQEQHRILETLTKKYSAPLEQLLDQLNKRDMAMDHLKLEHYHLTETLIQNEVNQWLEKMEDDLELGGFSPIYIVQYEDRPLEHLRRLSQMFVEAQDKVGILLISKQATQSLIVLARPKSLNTIDCKAIFKECSAIFEVKGGGTPHSVQGSLPDSEKTEALIQLVEELLL